MSNQTGTKAISVFLNQDNVKKKFGELLGTKAQGFITSVLSAVNSNELLKNADQQSIYMSAMMAATLDLPINQNLGFAYLVPFNQKQKDGSYKQLCQFMIGYKGFIQLAMRSGQFKTISATPIFEGQLIDENPLTGYVFDFKAKKSEKIIGYAGYFSLVNGFEKVSYMTAEQLSKHGKKYSQTFKKGYGLWNDDFDSMALKTVLKLLLSKYAPLSIEMQKAVLADQGVIKDSEAMDIDYVDTIEEEPVDKKRERLLLMIEEAKNQDDLLIIEDEIPVEDKEVSEKYRDKWNNLK